MLHIVSATRMSVLNDAIPTFWEKLRRDI